MSAIIRIDQTGLPTGVPGQSRSDGLDTGALVTLRSMGGGATHKFQLLWVPDADTTAVASLAPTGTASIWTFSPTASVYGTYRIELIVDEGLPTEERSIRLFAIRTVSKSLRIPALNERSDPRATLLVDGAAQIEASEDNEPEAGGPFAGGNYGGWYRALREVIEAVEAGGGGGAPTGPAGGQLSGTYPNPSVAGITETAGPTALTVGNIADGQITRRVGSTLVGQNLASNLAIHDTQTGVTPKLVGAVWLDVSMLQTQSRVFIGTAAGGTATLELRRFTGGTLIYTFAATGALQNVSLSPATAISNADWYEFYLYGDAIGTVTLIEGIHLEVR